MGFEIARSRCRHGMMSYNSHDSTIGASLTKYGEWAEHEIELLSRIIPAGATVLDVGANIGCHSVAFSRMVGPTGRVMAFEPFSDNFAMLRLNTREQGNVIATQALVGASQGVATLDLRRLAAPGENYGAISYKRIPQISGEEMNGADLAISAQVALDMFAALPVEFVKIDVEGMEFDVLIGARGLIAKRRPIFYFEQNSAAMFPSIASLLFEMGYQLFWHVCYPFNRSNFRRDRENIFGAAIELNVLAIPRSKFAEKPELFDRIRNDVNEARSIHFDPPAAIDALGGRDVRAWADLLVPAPAGTV